MDDMKGCIPDWTFGDERLPTQQEQRSLVRLIYLAFVDLRALAKEGKSEQARALAEAFHNVALMMYSDRFSFGAFVDFLKRYQETFDGQAQFNYLAEWEKLNGHEIKK